MAGPDPGLGLDISEADRLEKFKIKNHKTICVEPMLMLFEEVFRRRAEIKSSQDFLSNQMLIDPTFPKFFMSGSGRRLTLQ